MTIPLFVLKEYPYNLQKNRLIVSGVTGPISVTQCH